MLYPNDEPEQGKRLRLLQQYFFVSCSLQHVLHIMDDLAGASVHELPQRFAVQLNDTHPAIGVAELMRLLVDERRIDRHLLALASQQLPRIIFAHSRLARIFWHSLLLSFHHNIRYLDC